MDYWKVANHLRTMRNGVQPHIDFLTPVESVAIAANIINNPKYPCPTFGNQASSYATNIGLMDVIKGRELRVSQYGQQGESYTRLAKLASHSDTEICNNIIIDLFRHNLEAYDKSLITRLCRVVGELHDNVPSHSQGIGYSAAQVFKSTNPCITFAIADAGCGLLSNVRRVKQNAINHADAIKWCITPGNTTANSWVDSNQLNPNYLDKIRENEDNHAGLGLDELTKLVDKAQGEYCIWSGDAQYERKPNGIKINPVDFCLQGVIIEVVIPLRPKTDKIATVENNELQKLAERIGI